MVSALDKLDARGKEQALDAYTRTEYLLNQLTVYKAQSPAGIELQTSRAVMEILKLYFRGKKGTTAEDQRMLDRCGPLLVPAVMEAAQMLKDFPIEIAEKAYPVLYHQFFHPDGIAADLGQLKKRMALEDISDENEIRENLTMAVIMLSSLLFAEPVSTAITTYTYHSLR